MPGLRIPTPDLGGHRPALLCFLTFMFRHSQDLGTLALVSLPGDLSLGNISNYFP